MKKTLAIVTVLCSGVVMIFGFSCANIQSEEKSESKFKTGDVIYQSSDYGQSKAVKLATHSKYSHVGMIVSTDSGLCVFEAVQPVQVIKLDQWLKRSEGKYCLQRSIKPLDTLRYKSGLDSMITKLTGKPYDILFEWSNEKFYCSELVWKVYHDVFKTDLCALKQLKDFDLSHPYTAKLLKERYGVNLPLEQKVVAPEDLYQSKLLKIISED